MRDVKCQGVIQQLDTHTTRFNPMQIYSLEIQTAT